MPSWLPIVIADCDKFTELLNNWLEQSVLYLDLLKYKELHPFPLETMDETTYYYSNIGRINQEIASVHLASGVLGRFITTVGRSKVEQQIKLLGGDLNDEDLDLLVDSGHKSLTQLLADKHIDLGDIAPSFIPSDIPVMQAHSLLPLPALPVPLLPAHDSLAPGSAGGTVAPASASGTVARPTAVSDGRIQSSSLLSYIDETPIAQPQPSRPILALSLGGSGNDPLHTPTFQPVSSPPVPKVSAVHMDVDVSLPPARLLSLPMTMTRLNFKKLTNSWLLCKRLLKRLKLCSNRRKLKCKSC